MISRVGAHVSTAGGVFRGLEKAGIIGAGSIQIFGSSPRSWNRRKISETEIEDFLRLRQKLLGDGRVYIHACYLINFGSTNKEAVSRSSDSLSSDLKLADMIGASGVVVHPGTLKDGQTLEYMAKNIRKVIDEGSYKAKVLIENSAGGGSSVPTTLDQIAELVGLIDWSDAVGVCIDTAHLWGFGIDISTVEKVERFGKELESKLKGLSLPIVHMNDSKVRLGSLLDRHENLGDGQIGLEGLKAVVGLNVFANSDFILEVPGMDKSGPDKQNIDILSTLFE